jgi:hypothetical protein
MWVCGDGSLHIVITENFLSIWMSSGQGNHSTREEICCGGIFYLLVKCGLSEVDGNDPFLCQRVIQFIAEYLC